MSTLPVFHPHVPSAYGTTRSLLMLFQSLQITLRNRGLGAMSFDQMAFNEEDIRDPSRAGGSDGKIGSGRYSLGFQPFDF